MYHLKGWIKGISATLCVIALTCAAQASSFVWTRGLNPSAGGAGKCVGTDGQGNVYLAGNFAGSLSIADTNLQSSTNASHTPMLNTFLIRYDSDGNPAWACQTTGQADQDVTAMALDPTGGIYIAGSFGRALLGGTNFGGIALTNVAPTNMFLAKFDFNGQFQWSKAVLSAQVKGVAIDHEGNLYVVGWFDYTTVFDNVSLTNTSVGASAFLVKYDSNGNLQWAKKLGGGAEANAVAVDGQGNLVVTGTYRSFTTFEGTTFPYLGGDHDMFLAKYDRDGKMQWIRQAGGTGDDVPTSIGVDQSNSIYVSGTFQHGIATFGDYSFLDYVDYPGEGGALPGQAGDVFTAKYSADGNVLWARHFWTPNMQTSYDIATDAAGNSHITGGSTNSVYIIGYDADGSLLDVNTAGNNPANQGRGLALDGLGNLYATGIVAPTNEVFGPDTLTNSTIFFSKLSSLFDATNPPVISTQISNQTAIATSNFVFGIGVASGSPLSYQWQFNGVDIPQATNSILQLSNLTFAASGNYNVIVSNSHGAVTSAIASLKVEFPQEFIWARKAGGANFDEARAVTVDTNGNSYVTGVFQTIANFEPLRLTNYNTSTLVFNWDIFVAKYDPAGNVLWVRQAGGTNIDEPRAIAVDHEGSVYVAGIYAGIAKFGGITITNNPNYGCSFIAKYDGDGNALWVQRLPLLSGMPNGTNNIRPYAMAVDSTNGIYLTGGSEATASLGTNTVPRGFFLAKVSSAGDFEWVQTAGTTNTSSSVVCYGTGVSVDTQDRIFVTGYFTNDMISFGTNILTKFQYEVPERRSFVARYDAAGNSVWARRLFRVESPTLGIAADEDGNVFITGYVGGAQSFAGQLLTYSYGTNLFLVKYDVEGTPLWGRIAETSGVGWLCAGTSVATDASGSVYVTGTNNVATKFNKDTSVEAGGFVAKYGSGGNFHWARSSGTSPSSVTRVGANAWVTGSFVLLKSFGVTNLVSSGDRDIFVAKLGINPPVLNTTVTNQFVLLGSNATLRVTGTGTGPLSYQWFLNGVAISGGTSSTLTLTNVQGANAGSYSVAVSNPAGTVNSTVGVVQVVPVAEVPRVDGTNLVISWAEGFTLQISTNGVAGPYYDVPSASSPFTNSIEAPEQYFRLRN
jgi:Immunoglobulin domain/Beta-propeller repeat